MKTKRLTRMAAMIALSYIGSYITPFTGPIKTAAFDSMPGFFSAVWISPLDGCLVGAVGHLFTSLLRGFPLSFPVHLVVAMHMALICYLFGWLWRKTKLGAIVVCSILNGVVSPLALVTFSHLTFPFLWSLVPVLLFASVANILVASALAMAMPKSMKKA